MAEDNGDEPCIPRAALNKLIKEIVPHVRVANESRDLLHSCCVEFVKTVGAEANRICAQEQKKTISQEHVLKALETLGFGYEYVQAAQSVLDECKEAAQKRLQRQNSRLDKCGIPEEVLLQKQQELFEKARADQAEQEQAQVAMFQQMMVAQQQHQLQLQHQQQLGTMQIPATISGECSVIRTIGDPGNGAAAKTSAPSTSIDLLHYQHTQIKNGEEETSAIAIQTTSVPIIDVGVGVSSPNMLTTAAASSAGVAGGAPQQPLASHRMADLDEDYDAPE